MIPGANLLNQAFKLIAKQTVGYLRALGDTPNQLGYKIAEYAPRTDIQGSFQPIPRRLYQVYGLDMEKNYANFYTSNDVQDIQRAKQGDLIEYNGKRWLCQSESDWFPLDGWTGVMIVDVGAIPPAPPAFDAGNWAVTTNAQDEIVMTVSAWPGGTPDYIERKIDNGQWLKITPFPFNGILPDGTETVSIRAVVDGARSAPNEKVIG